MDLVNGQFETGDVSINADGAIEPSTAPIEYKEGLYVLSGNISGGLVIHRSNIVIDGCGFALDGKGVESVGVDLQNNVTSVPSSAEIWNVTIKNLSIIDFNFSIKTNGGGNDTFYNDYIANEISGLRGGIFLWACSNNSITHCSISGDPAIYMHFCSNHNSVVENNLYGGASIEVSGSENFDRNYWSDYHTKYPSVTEVDSWGYWTTPYQIVIDNSSAVYTQDNHPQKNPYSVQSNNVPEFSLAAILIIASLTLATAILLKKKNITQPIQRR